MVESNMDKLAGVQTLVWACQTKVWTPKNSNAHENEQKEILT